MQKLRPLFENDGIHENKRWTLSLIVERLKSIRITECYVGGIIVKQCVSKPDEEQEEILDLLGVKLK